MEKLAREANLQPAEVRCMERNWILPSEAILRILGDTGEEFRGAS